MSLSFSDSTMQDFLAHFSLAVSNKIAVLSRVFQLKSSWSCADLGPGTSGQLSVVSLFSFSNSACNEGGNGDNFYK